jgi:hypothetical protein
MESGYRTPLVDLFRRGEADRDVRLMAARGLLAPRAQEQIALLMLLLDDEDGEIARTAAATIAALPRPAVEGFIARPDIPDEMRRFFAASGVEAAAAPSTDLTVPLVDALEEPAKEDPDRPTLVSSLSVVERVKLAMKGSREQRAQLIRDTNRMVATAVLSSPKLNDAEIEAFAKMANVSEEVLRMIGTNRSWLKNYAVVHGLVRNPKTPPGISMQLLHRLVDRDVKAVIKDRNVPEVLRTSARRMATKAQR